MPGDRLSFDGFAGLVEAGHGGEKKLLREALDDALAQVTASADRASGAATLTLVVKVKPNGRGAIIVSAEVRTKIPEPGALPIPLYLDRRGNLVTEDPDQGRLPLEAVDARRAAGGDRE